MQINRHYLNLQESYLFSLISKKVNEYKAGHPGHDIIRLGIGDVTLPLVPAVVSAMQRAVSEMGARDSFRGYGEEQGYLFLRQAVCGYYAKRGVALADTEVFISDGAKSDLGNILDIFDADCTVLVPNPVYPVYVDTNIMAGRPILYANGTPENSFLPMPEGQTKADIIYLCSPNNPTGAVYTAEQLAQWVAYAREQDAVILFDGAYEAYVTDPALPRSIYEIDGARECAIEFCSLSKTAGFTGTRCGYTVVPHALIRNQLSLHRLWLRRQSTKFNGVPYIIQRGAEAVFSDEGSRQVKTQIDYYLQNARIIADTLSEQNIWFTGGRNSPYLWLKCPGGLSSWEYFDRLLSACHIVGTPGAGFGGNGEGFFRLSAFGDRDDVRRAMARLRASCMPQ